MRLSLTTILLLDVALCAHAQITIDQMPAAFDTLTSTHLCALPARLAAGHFQATVVFDTCRWKSVEIDGLPVACGGKFQLGNVDFGATYDLCVTTIDDEMQHHTLAFTFLPVVRLYGSFSNDYSRGTLSVTMPGDTDPTTLDMRAKWRGGSTNYNHSHKRNYHIKLLDAQGEKLDHSFFGLRSDNNWLLDAGQIDLARVRNHVGMSLWNDFASKPYYASQEPKALNGVRSRLVEVFLNDEYRGVYSMGEAVDRKQLKLKKTDADTGELRGQLWKTTNWSSAVMMYEAPFLPFRNAETWYGYETKYPDPDETTTDYRTLQDALRFVSEADAATFVAEAGDRFDLPVLIDYYILMNVLNSVDNTGKNLYWAVYDRTRSGQLTLVPWDLDATVGQYWNNTPEDGQVTHLRNPDFKLVNYVYVYPRLFKNNPQDFAARLKQRYIELRQGVLHTDSLVSRYVSTIDTLQWAGAAAREEARWSGDSDICHLPLDFEQQKAYIAQWLRARMPFIDYTVFGVPPIDLNDDQQCDIIDVSLLIDMVLGKISPVPQADLNGDGIVDVADVDHLTNLIIRKQ